MQLFYNADINERTTEFTFSKDESRHIVKVLRRNTGDLLKITNGVGWLFEAEIISASINKCVAAIVNQKLHNPCNYELHIAIAPTKMNDRFEWFLEKATEIGIDTITPIICEHSERKIIKKERLERILQSAMKQSLNCFLPKLNNAITFNSFIGQKFDGDLFIAHCESSLRKSLKNELRQNTKTTILIGPEGDFSVKEIEMAVTNKFIPVTLGETRLRTETAGIVACHSVAFVNEV